MGAKILGQDILDYWKTWPLGYDFYVDETNLADRTDADGPLCLAGPNGAPDETQPILPHRRYHVEGVLCWQGPLKNPEPEPRPLDAEIRRWAKQRKEQRVVVVLPNTPEARAVLEDFVKTQGWRLG